MSRFRRIEIIEPSPSFFIQETSIYAPKYPSLSSPFFPSFFAEDELDIALDLLAPRPRPALVDFLSPVDEFDAISDLIEIEKVPFYTSTRRVHRQIDRFSAGEHHLRGLSNRVSTLERSFDRLVNPKSFAAGSDRKYTWTAEIEGKDKYGFDRKYKWTAEKTSGKKVEKNYKVTAEIKSKDKDAPFTRTYTFRSTSGTHEEKKKEEKKVEKKEEKKKVGSVRVVEIEEPSNHGVVVLRHAFARRLEKCKGKRKELSVQDAALLIQRTFRAYLIRRSQSLRALRDLAIAKAKLKELRALFNNFSYRRLVSRDAEERQRFSEKIIVLLLTADGIEGADLMVRAAKRSIVDELEAMLDVVDPQPPGKSIYSRRRTFDMPDGIINKDLIAGVAEVVQMLNEEEEHGEHL
ncbi:BAG family molecular chaperone regulator 7 [Impatiens glandulifera]|uniref:BAG family molecular chaperone regulator 7 n=1 Tax=Impatiens glandulifera TaxID=253017 RepID=UPI001FB0716F|nr:BAG family molecular chaperone regulator 7 [Impatiens glandulifera]